MLFKERFLAVYVGLGVLLVLPYFALALLWNHTAAVQHHTEARVSSIERELGPKTLRQLEDEAFKIIDQTGAKQGITITSLSVLKTVKHGQEVDIYVAAQTTAEALRLEVVFRRGLYQLMGIDLAVGH